MVLWELYWRVLGSSWGSWGGSWDPLGALLGLSWGPLGSPGGPLGAILEAIDHRMGRSPICVPPPGPSKLPLWALLGALLGQSWALLGPSSAIFGPFWATFGLHSLSSL